MTRLTNLRLDTLRTTTCEHCDCSFDFDPSEHIVFDDGSDFHGDRVRSPLYCSDCFCAWCDEPVAEQGGGVRYDGEHVCANCVRDYETAPVSINYGAVPEMGVWAESEVA